MERKQSRWETSLILLAILLIGLSFHVVGLGWGEGQPIHPDEEFLRQVTAAVTLPDSLSLYLDTARSPLNPYNRGYGFFVYGTLPLFLTRAVGEALDQGCRDGTAVSLPARLLAPLLLGTSSACWPGSFSGSGARHLGRLLAALLDTGSILFVFLAGRRLGAGYGKGISGPSLGLLAAALYALAVLPIQQSHFYTVDAYANFFVAVTLYLALCLAGQPAGGQPAGGQPVGAGLAPAPNAPAPDTPAPNAPGWGNREGHAPTGLAPRGCSYIYAFLAGLTTGLGVACKISVWPLGLLVGLAALLRALRPAPCALRPATCDLRPATCDLRPATCDLRRAALRLLLLGFLALLGAFLAFRLAQPYAFLGPDFFGLRLNPQWLQNMAEVRGLMSGAVDTYPGHQWTNRLPLVFPWVNMVFWGLGLPLGLAAWAGWGIAAVRLGRRWRRKGLAALVSDPLLLPWLWATGYFLYQGTQWVKSVRYLLPVYPALILLAAWLLLQLWVRHKVQSKAPSHSLRPAPCDLQVRARHASPLPAPCALRPATLYLATCSLLLATFLWALAFTSVYRRPHTRIAASRWIFQNVPTGSVLATEHWDWAPPLRVDGKDPFGGMYRGLSTSSDGTLQLYHDDTPQKREALLNWLDEADYIIIGSNRLYASIVRLPTRYPLTIAYYRALFSGQLGFELVADFTSYPAIGPFQFPDTEEPFPVPEAPYQYRAAPVSVPLPPAEEAFSVYDHPRVLIFRKTAAYSRARAEALLPASLLDNVLWVTPKQETMRTWRRILPFLPSGEGPQAGRRPLLDARTWADQQSGGTWSAMFRRESPLNRSSFLAAVVWYLAAGGLGWLAFPLLWRALPRLPDRGYGIARAVGLLTVSYLTWLSASLRVLPNTRGTVALAVLLLAAAGGLSLWRRGGEFRQSLNGARPLLLVYEGLFLALYAFWAWVRAQNPDLWHPVVGGEKPMDFAYLNAVIKSTWFPPYNPWFAGGYINYYYFGFVLVGTLAKLTGIMPSIAYNLALALFYALTGGAAFSVAFNLVARSQPQSEAEWRPGAGSQPRSAAEWRPYIAGFLAVFFLLVLGNLGEAKLLFDGFRLVAGEPPFRSTIPGMEALVQALRGFGMVLGGTPLPFRPETPYWNPTRMIPPDASGVGPITEFPAFTFLYADLHAHLLALPYTLCTLVVMVEWVLGLRRGRPTGLSLLLAGLLIGALRATNTWDYPTYLLLAMAVLAFCEFSRLSRLSCLSRLSSLSRPLLLAGLTVLLFLPYIRAYIAPYNRVRLWTDARTPLDIYLWLLGQFLFPVGTLLLVDAWRVLSARRLSHFAVGVGGLLFCGLLVAQLGRVPVAAVALPLGVLALVLAFLLPAHRALPSFWVAVALALTLGVEVLVLQGDIGRMNTVFKFHFQAWTLLSVSAAAALVELVNVTDAWPHDARRVWWGVMAAMLFAMSLFPVMSIPAKVGDRFTHATGPTLDGMAYIRYSRTGDVRGEVDLGPDYGGILWLLENVQGSPVILEGLGAREYLWGNRVSIYTGLPAVVGWRWHEVQQGMGEEVDRRHWEVQECYNTPDTERALAILRQYHVRYVYVGPYERLYYDPAGLAKFDVLAARGLLRVVYDREGVRIYEVVNMD
jgi:YYY domain-containing protein